MFLRAVIVSIFPTVLLLLLCACLLPAQVEQASITGIISDKSGAPIPGAQVLAESLDTRVRTTGSSNSSGNFYLRLLPGPYRVTISHEGFSSAVVPSLTLTVAQQAALNIPLEVSSVQQSVTVTEVSPLIEQETASLGTTINPEQFVNLPTDNRNPYSLVTLAPGVNPKGNAGTGPLINGGRSNSNAVLLDGGQVLNSTTNDTSYTPPLESVEQFRVQTSAFQAEYGRTAGGVLNVTTKTGTNQLHGAVYEYFKNDALNANTYSNDLIGLNKAIVRHNEFGGAIGGPVLLPKLYRGRDHTFFFAALEFVPDRAPQSIIATVPTAAQRAGDFSQTLGADGNLIIIYDPLTSAVNPTSPSHVICHSNINGRSEVACLAPEELRWPNASQSAG